MRNLLDIRIGTMVRGNAPDPAAYVRQIVGLGFESIEPFRAAHPDISVFYDAVASSTQSLALLRRQRGQPEIDVVLLDLATARTATEEGLLEAPSPESMPVLGELAPASLFPGIAGRSPPRWQGLPLPR